MLTPSSLTFGIKLLQLLQTEVSENYRVARTIGLGELVGESSDTRYIRVGRSTLGLGLLAGGRDTGQHKSMSR